MRKLLKIGIAGCGAIGSTLAKAIVADFSGHAELSGLYDNHCEKSRALAGELKNKKLAVRGLDELVNKAQLIIEATRAESAFEVAAKAIASSKDIMIMSVGGILKGYKKLALEAGKKGSRVFIPSGAICGIDGLKAAGCGRIRKVVLTTRKPLRAFIGNPYIAKKKIRLDKVKKEILLFEGGAHQAIRAFPQNINVAATLSIAGIGARKTTVRIIASPTASRNTHEVEIESDSGLIFTRTENIIHPQNPKTSYLAVLSAIATLKQILNSVKIGT